jgi:hypothetical protein
LTESDNSASCSFLPGRPGRSVRRGCSLAEAAAVVRKLAHGSASCRHGSCSAARSASKVGRRQRVDGDRLPCGRTVSCAAAATASNPRERRVPPPLSAGASGRGARLAVCARLCLIAASSGASARIRWLFRAQQLVVGLQSRRRWRLDVPILPRTGRLRRWCPGRSLAPLVVRTPRRPIPRHRGCCPTVTFRAIRLRYRGRG